MRSAILLLTTLVAASTFGQKKSAKNAPIYYPGSSWEHRTPESVGVDGTLLRDAIQFAIDNETRAPADLKLNHYQSFGREPFGDAIGPIKTRGPMTGIIVKNGYIIAEWGDPLSVDMTHSVTKSFLSAVVGVAYDRGLIKSIRDTVRSYVPPILVYRPEPATDKANEFNASDMLMPFESDHNRTITWDDLLRQTSDWEGTLWGKPDWADRPSSNREEWLTRKRKKPGTAYEYNDVRVNALALAALSVWRKPLPEVLKESIMDRIGASNTWRWYGYENSYIVLDGKIVQSVSGGGHWGGGMFIHAQDMARFGYLTLRRGKWKEEQLLSEQWVKWSLTPTVPQPTYGFMNWFLNTDQKYLPSAPASAFVHIGNGTNMVYVDPEHDLVAVVRWIENSKMDEFVKTLLTAIKN